MTMHKALHSSDDVDRLYVSRKEGGRGHTSIENSVDTSKSYHKKRAKTGYSHKDQKNNNN